jgi:hypothetical protein
MKGSVQIVMSVCSSWSQLYVSYKDLQAAVMHLPVNVVFHYLCLEQTQALESLRCYMYAVCYQYDICTMKYTLLLLLLLLVSRGVLTLNSDALSHVACFGLTPKLVMNLSTPHTVRIASVLLSCLCVCSSSS